MQNQGDLLEQLPDEIGLHRQRRHFLLKSRPYIAIWVMLATSILPSSSSAQTTGTAAQTDLATSQPKRNAASPDDTQQSPSQSTDQGYRDADSGIPNSEQAAVQALRNLQPPLTPPAPGTTFAPLVPSNDIDKLKIRQGAGWCVYSSKDAKIAYYSKVFDGSPTDNTDPVGVAKALHQMEALFQKFLTNSYSLPVGESLCSFGRYDLDYVQEDYEQSNKFNLMLQNYKVIQTTWIPQTVAAP